MFGDAVVVRADRGQPLKRVAMGGTTGHVYIANPASLRAVERGESGPIGFSRNDVFIFEEQVFRELEGQWIRENKTDPELWNRLIPFNG